MNVVDFLVVMVAIFNLILNLSNIDNFLHLRMLRAIRVLRILKMSSELKKVINCLFNSIQKICHFLLLYILINYVYALIGKSLFV